MNSLLPNKIIIWLKWENDPLNLSTERVLTRSHKLGIKKKAFKLKNATISVNRYLLDILK